MEAGDSGSGDQDVTNSIGKSGMILIQRYMYLQSNALAALCNAAQVPGENLVTHYNADKTYS